jgi:hypothetical protein
VSVTELDFRGTILLNSVHILAYVIIGRQEEAMKVAFIKQADGSNDYLS